jgi:hypothetical protein
VSITTVKLPARGSVGSQFVRCEALAMNTVPLQQFPGQTQGGAGVAVLLIEHVQSLTLKEIGCMGIPQSSG